MNAKVNVIFHSEAILEELGARQLFSGGIEGILAVESTDTATHQEVETTSGNADSVSSDLADSIRQEIVFIDTDVENYQQLLNDIISQDSDTGRNIEVILLDNQRDGIEQISAILANYQNLDAVHLISHGSEGQVDIGSTSLNSESLNQNLSQISEWGNAFTEEGDFLIYGCNLAATEDGQSLVQSLSSLTHTDVAASDDLTGQAALGGDWDLEYRTGNIETSLALDLSAQAEFQGVLNEYIVSTTADSGAGSLRQAIINANDNPNSAGNDVITFDIGADGSQQTITLLSALDEITEAVTIDGYSQYGALTPFSYTPLITIDGNGGSYDGFDISSAGSTIQGLVINNFDGSGIRIHGAGATLNTIQGNYIGTNVAGTAAIANTGSGIVLSDGASNNLIGGTTTAERNIISGNGEDGVFIQNDASSNTVAGNYIGVDVTGSNALGNIRQGVTLYNGANNNIIGGSVTGAANVIASNGGPGIAIDGEGGATTSDNIIQGNYIGTDSTGIVALGNETGILLFNGAENNLVGGVNAGEGNIIAFSTYAGIALADTSGTGNSFLRNSIYSNGSMGIDVAEAGSVWGITANDVNDSDLGANNLQNYPELTTAIGTDTEITIVGTFNSVASSYYRIEFFASSTSDVTGYGEARDFIGFVNVATDPSGNFNINSTFTVAVENGHFITATATKTDASYAVFSDTSEFSQNIVADVLNESVALATGFVTTWKTDNPGTSDSNTITIPIGSGTTDFTVYWGDGTSSTYSSGPASHTYATAGTYTVAIVGDFPGINFDGGGDGDKLLSIEQWGNIVWQDLNDAFDGADNLVINASDAPDLSNVTSLAEMFRGATSINADLSAWDTSNITDMQGMFREATAFNQDIGGWDTASVTDMRAMFYYASAFNQNIGDWNTSNVTTMAYMFNAASNFNQAIVNWDTTSVTTMTAMFYSANTFNQNIGGWNTSNVTDMSHMFRGASIFNQDISGWDTSSVTSMKLMFRDASTFNQAIDGWDTSSVTDMSQMFYRAYAFNHAIGGWNTSSVTDMGNMFFAASTFDQAIDAWDISNVISMSNMLNNTNISIRNYDALLTGWASQTVQSGLNLGASGLHYSLSFSERQSLIDSDGWTITDAGSDSVVTIELENNSYSALENAGTITINYIITSDIVSTTDKQFVFTITDGTATNGSDYTISQAVTITIAAGDYTSPVTQSLIITLNDDVNVEADETFTVSVSAVSDENDIELGGVSSAVSTIIDNDIVAVDDIAITDEDIDLTAISVLANDLGKNLTVIAASASNGTVSINADFSLNYRPNADFNGTDTITYTLSDGTITDAGTVIITINSVNDAPTFDAGDGIIITDVAGNNDFASSVLVQHDGKLVVVGISDNGSNANIVLSRYNTDGSLDGSFGINGIVTTDIAGDFDGARSVIVQNDGKLVVTGITIDGGVLDFILIRYNIDGSLDNSFGVNGIVTTDIGAIIDYGTSLTVQDDGKLVVGGYHFSATNYDFTLIRYNIDGSLDTDFGNNGIVITDIIGGSNDEATSISLQSDGKLVLAGTVMQVGDSDHDISLVRYNTDGSLDSSFGTNGIVITDIAASSDDTATSVITQSDGRLVVAGGSDNELVLARYNTDGSLDISFGVNGIVTTNITAATAVNSLTLQGDGKLTVVADNGTLVRYNTEGSLDASFGTNGIVLPPHTLIIANSITVQADGQLVVVGYDYSGADEDVIVIRYNTDGSLDTRFNLSNTLDNNVSYIENGVAVVLDNNVQLFDAELSEADNFDGATLTLERDTGANVDDDFSATANLAALAQGGNLTISGSIIGTVTTNSAGTLVLSFNSNATQALVNETLQSIAYSNSSDNPAASVQIDWIFNDGNTGSQGTGGALEVTGSTIVTITAVNDTPTIQSAIGSQSLLEDFASYTIDLNAAFADIETSDANLSYAVSGNSNINVSISSGIATISNTADWNGSENITFTVTDEGGLTQSQIITMDVVSVRDIVADSFSTLEDTPINISPLGNDTFSSGVTLSLWGSIASYVGTLVVEADNTLTYTPAADFNGSTTVNYRVTTAAGKSEYGIFTLTVNPVIDGVVDTVVVDEDSTATFNVLANDNFEDANVKLEFVTQPLNGAITYQEDGTISYTANANFNGTDSFSYWSDSYEQTLVYVTINAVNDAPVANNDTASTDEDTALNNINVLSNDTDIDGDSLTVTLASAVNGSVSVNMDGTLNYSPNTNFNGTDTITYTISDGTLTDTATMSITVNAVNDAPLTSNEVIYVDQNTSLSNLNVLANDSDIEGDTLAVNSVNALNGSVKINADSTINYTPNFGFSGSDTITYIVSDGNGGQTIGKVIVTVNSVTEVIEEKKLPTSPEVEESLPVDEIFDAEDEIAEEAPIDVVPEQKDSTVKGDDDLKPSLSIVDSDKNEDGLNAEELLAVKVSSARLFTFVEKEDLSDDTTDFWQQSQQQTIEEQAYLTRQMSLNSGSEMTSISEILWSNISLMRDQMDEDLGNGQYEDVEIEFVAGATTMGIMAGVVSWVLRGGALLSSLLTSVSVFTKFDPLAMVSSSNNKKDAPSGGNSKVESMFENQHTKN